MVNHHCAGVGGVSKAQRSYLLDAVESGQAGRGWRR